MTAPDHSSTTAPANDGWDGVRQLHPAVLASRREAGDPLLLIDVREPWEWERARVVGARLIPLGTFARAADDLDPAAEIVIYCHHGARSQSAAMYLAERGFRRLWNLSGGIDRWSLDVDPAVPRY